ncbi:MAG: hypothetical protein E6J80_01545 [Deltaproteobacteria bacterium]|nr:MAG: hypothetical protein E6J80_01545 [Deltaproteobacteria bacterium]
MIKAMRGDVFNDGKATVAQIRQTAAVTADLAREVSQLTRHIDQMVSENRNEVSQLLTNLDDTSRHLKEVADTIRTDPSELVWGKTLPEREIPDK